jgi:hypothetical protein
MYVTPTGRMLHHFRQGRSRSTCGRFYRNAAFEEAGLWWPEAGRTDDDCWTCRERLTSGALTAELLGGSKTS